MTDSDASQKQFSRRPVRWWPAIVLLIVAGLAILWVRSRTDSPFQQRNIDTAKIGIIATILLLVWWTFFSRVPNRLRLTVTFGLVGMVVLGAALFRFRGVSGDLVPIPEFRWTKRALPAIAQTNSVSTLQRLDASTSPGFPQFLGSDRNGVLPGPRLDTNWTAHPPAVVWRQKVGAAWSGFVIAGDVCVTQEQRGENECVVAYELATGRQIWLHADQAHYNTVIAGEGPRATPTIESNRVFTCGATGILNCLELATGRVIWTQNVVSESGGNVPEWGIASSPLLADGLVIVGGGNSTQRSLLAFHAEDGRPAWSAAANHSYASPFLATLADVPQVLTFNSRVISAHDPTTGNKLWESPWGSGDVVCSSPVVVSSNRVVFSSAYGFGAKLLEISRDDANSRLAARLIWKSIRMKSKFGHIFVRDGSLYGLDDGMFACVDLKDGLQRWKEGRYGHGQGLLVGDLYLLMAESGELVLLRPTPDAPNELARFRAFSAKTWNPPALSGDLLLVRNDQEAACLRLKLVP
jgi:outer membrane protein assembly factor BamB